MKTSTRPGFVLFAPVFGRVSGMAPILTGCIALAWLPTLALAQSGEATTSWPSAPAAAESNATAVPSSQARTAQDYRRDAATHLYEKSPKRIYKGRMPPLLYAIGVLQVEINNQGRINSISWMRAPNHAPEVIAEIERMIRLAEPFPAPAYMGRVVYTDTWLWHKSGLFQLDTLTEGQD